MAGNEAVAVETAEPNIDDMDDAQFEAFKAEQGKEPEVAKPEEVAKPAVADDDDDPKGDMVPHGRFHRERERRQEAEAQRVAAEARADLAARRMTELLETLQPKQPAAPVEEAPDPEKDIFGYVRSLENRIKTFEGESSLTKEQQQEQQQFDAIMSSSYADVQAFSQEKPEMQAAASFLMDALVKEARLYGLNEAQTEQHIRNRERDEFLWAVQHGKRPAQHYLDLAVMRGFNPAAAPTQQGAAQPANVQAEIAKLVKNEATRNAAKSLSGSGAATGVSVTAADLLEMSDADYAAFKKTHGDNAMAKAMGL